MSDIQIALREAMERNGHSQPDVSKVTGVSQSNISRVLSGQRKRVTASVRRLCQYAGLNAEYGAPEPDAQRRLSQAVRGAIGDNPHAALALASVIDSLAPLLRAFKPAPTSGADNDQSRAH